jgi:hypothetical protein
LADLLATQNQGREALLTLRFVAETALVDGAVWEGRYSGSMPTAFYQPLMIYALVDGGWLPPPLVMPPRLAVDRNVVSALVTMRQAQMWADADAFDWWMSFLGSAWITPVLYAFEGSRRSTPSYDDFVSEFEQAARAIAAALPEVKLVQFDEAHFRAGYALVSEAQLQSRKDEAFLLDAVPLLVRGVRRENLRSAEEQLRDLARAHHFSAASLVLLVTLSCLYEDPAGKAFRIGRRIIKPRRRYSAEDAYNAVMDLNALELMLYSRRLSPGEHWNFCTRDRALAALWCALELGEVRETASGMRGMTTLSPALFPRLSEAEVGELQARLVADQT